METGFQSIPPQLRRTYYECVLTPEDTDQTKTFKLQNLYHLRHDFIHFYCENIMGIKSNFNTLKKLKDVFDFLPDQYSKMSPDIVIERNNQVSFIDISVSRNKTYNVEEKKSKYLPILDYLMSEGFESNGLFVFWVAPSLENLDDQTRDFKVYLTNCGLPSYSVSKSLFDQLMLAYENVSEMIQTIRLSLPNSFLSVMDETQPPTTDILSEQQLEDSCKKSYPEFENLISHVTDADSSPEEIFNTLINDPEIYDYLKDEKHDHNMYSRAFTKLRSMESSFPIFEERPSFFIPFAPIDEDVLETLSFFEPKFYNSDGAIKILKKEQSQVLRMLGFIDQMSDQIGTNWPIFCNSIHLNLKKCLAHDAEFEIYNTGLLTGNIEDELALTVAYTDFRKREKSTISKRAFFKNNLKNSSLRDVLPYIYRNKCIKLPQLYGPSKEFIDKSGTSYSKTHNLREYSVKRTVQQEAHEHISEFMDLLNESTNFPYTTHSFLGSSSGCDSPEMLKIKAMIFEEHKKFLNIIQYRNCHSFSKHTSLIATQLLHFNELNTSDNTYCCFTGGQPNTLHIVRGGSIKRGADIGQAYFTIFLTRDKRWCSKVYGKIHTTKLKYKGKEVYLCKTPWVRLSSERLSFMKDQYYSTLSTSYDTWARNKTKSDYKGFMTHAYTFRTCVSVSPSQRVAELLMDTRYIFMSSLSTYSNVEKLIVDKFAPPYKNSMEQFIVRQLERKSQQIIQYLSVHPPKPNKPGFSSKKRLNHTLGGEITLPSLWSDFVLTDMQSIFDDIFVYVHTSKEASSEYHEQVKAINTILKYQREYDNLSTSMKHGMANPSDLKQWLLSGSQVGCSARTVYHATKMFAVKYKGLYKSWDFKSTCLEEPLCNIVSTKSCIPEYERYETKESHEAPKLEKILMNINSLTQSGRSKYIINGKEFMKSYTRIDTKVDDTAEIVITKQNRVKVHDALIDWINRFGLEKNYVIDLATWNIRNNNCRIVTDTCIKAQYGAKREFYVINLGAKAMARLTENSYKCLAKVCKNEMISIPGDRKLMFIQEAISESILSSERRQDVLMYVNGDCTKWSACETMASFISLNKGLEDVFGKCITSYNMATFCGWANKRIQVPQSILKNLRFLSESTKYLENGADILSTQNFLQGMFNYSSSIKAVVATEFAIHMFKQNNPNVFFHCSHLEHSDDYSLIVRTRDLESFEKFRVYHKLSQKLCGINDSIKKTNIQSHIQEFISLFSFNGQLYYPNIKKTKEVGTNLPCTDFRSDAMSITSRVSEAIRIGVSLESAYFMQRIHCASLSDSYSLSPGMRNSVGTVKDIFSRPIELLGLPDTLPVLSVTIKGNPDNYRIYKFGGDKERKLIRALFVVGQDTYNATDLPSVLVKEELGELYSPTFSYPTRHNRLKLIREKINLNYDEALKYMSENLTDSIVKPVETQRFYIWLKAMYYNKSFSKAYMRISRSAMSLRHSMFSSKPCILDVKNVISPEIEKSFITIKKFINTTMSELSTVNTVLTGNQEKLLSRHLNCYNNCIELMYNLTKDSALVQREYLSTHTTVNRMPDPFKWLMLENSASNLLQFMINPKNFYSDRRSFLSETSLQRDIEKLKSYYNVDLMKTSISYCRQVFSELAAQSRNNAFGLTFVDVVVDLPGFIRQYFERGFLNGRTFNFIPLQKTKLSDPRTGKEFLAKDWKNDLTAHSSLLAQIALIYRCIVLRTELSSRAKAIEALLDCKILDSTCTIGEFLKKTNLDEIDIENAGEYSRKILCFMKSRLLGQTLELHKYVKSKFFYEVHYSSRSRVLKPFKEQADISFLGIRFRAYLYEEGTVSYLFLEMGNQNRVYWFYCYSIAQRVFGMISQTVLDERLLESRDFFLPYVTPELTYLLDKISVKSKEPIFFKKMNQVFLPTMEYQDANIPIVVQQVQITKGFINRERLNFSSNVHTSDLAAHVGNIQIFKLPFGNLLYENQLELEDPSLSNIKIDGVGMDFILRNKILIKYLKSQFDFTLHESEIPPVLELVMTNLSSMKETVMIDMESVSNQFDLNILRYKPDYQLEKNPLPRSKRTKEEYYKLIQEQSDEEETKIDLGENILSNLGILNMNNLELNWGDDEKETFETKDMSLGVTAVDSIPEKLQSMYEAAALLGYDIDSFPEIMEDKDVQDEQQISVEGLSHPRDQRHNFNTFEQTSEDSGLPSSESFLDLSNLFGIIDIGDKDSNQQYKPKNTIGSSDDKEVLEIQIESSMFGTQMTESSLRSLFNFNIVEPDTIELLEPDEGLEIEQETIETASRLRHESYKEMINSRIEITLEDAQERINNIEGNRDLYVRLLDIEDEEQGELFDPPPNFDEVEPSEESSSNENNIDGISWFQLVPSEHFVEGRYNYDKQCRQAMSDLNLYLLKCLVQSDVEEILSNRSDLSLLLTTYNYIRTKKSGIKLNKAHKCLMRAVFHCLRETLKRENNTAFTFADNMALKWKEGKMAFLATRGYEDKEDAERVASSRPSLKVESNIRNCDNSAYWVSAPLQQSDLDKELYKGFKTDEFRKHTPLARLLSELVPRIKKTEFTLSGDYGF